MWVGLIPTLEYQGVMCELKPSYFSFQPSQKTKPDEKYVVLTSATTELRKSEELAKSERIQITDEYSAISCERYGEFNMNILALHEIWYLRKD